MHPDNSHIGPYLVAALAVFVIYRRFRRSFGRQRLRPARMGIRMALLGIIGVSLLPVTLRSTDFLAAVIAGAAIGVALGLWGAKRTRFETVGAALYYIPHTYTGIAVSLVFLGRLVYRVVEVYAGGRGFNAADSADPTQGFAAASMVKSPFTLGLFFALIGYYLCYYSLVLWKSRHIKAEDIEAPTTAAAP
jgi:hypothetical protein